MASEYLNETVVYGGIRVRRADVERHLNHLGVSGPARMVYGRLPAVAGEPLERFDSDTGDWVQCKP